MMMINLKAATKKQADAGTLVIWDINTCPVPDKCDASRVGLCIRRALKNLGYNGPVTITAVGMLTDLPLKLLQSVSSTGIVFCHTVTGKGVSDALLQVILPRRLHRSNVLLVSPRNFPSQLEFLRQQEYNFVGQVFNAATSAEVESLWESYLKDTTDSEEEKRSETSECEWICSDCEGDEIYCAGQGFGNFINHLSSEDHHETTVEYLHDRVNTFYQQTVYRLRSDREFSGF